MRVLEFITGHVIYNLAYTYKFKLKTTFTSWNEFQVERSALIKVINLGSDTFGNPIFQKGLEK